MKPKIAIKCSTKTINFVRTIMAQSMWANKKWNVIRHWNPGGGITEVEMSDAKYISLVMRSVFLTWIKN